MKKDKHKKENRKICGKQHKNSFICHWREYIYRIFMAVNTRFFRYNCSQDGFIGYVKSKTIGGEQDVLYDHNFTEPVFSHISRESRINMAWHQVTNQSANDNLASILQKTKGINILSPTWFYLNDNNGNIASLASSAAA